MSQLNARTGFKSGRKCLARKLAELQPDIVHGHGTEEAYGLSAVESPFVSVVSVQGVISRILEVSPCLRFQLTAPRERECIEKGQNFMCRTHFDKGFVHEVNPSARIFHVAEAMGPIFFQSERQVPEPRMLFVGGYGEAKGIGICLEAFARIHEKNPDVYLDVVGGGSDAAFSQIRKRVQDLGLESFINFHGWLVAEEIAKLQAQSRVYAMTSKCENSPNVLAEALCSGTPCVAFDVGGVSSMFVDGESGYLIPPGEIEQFANAALRLLSDDERWQSFSEKARVFSQVNRPETVADASIEVYKILAQSNPAEEK
ncbi:glycosyltransferase [Kiritimatiellaeota bacterium B1221]|nr:glycosyltransferase [Kiritimatiellaeota bacterium B1221]